MLHRMHPPALLGRPEVLDEAAETPSFLFQQTFPAYGMHQRAVAL